jgi:hypothetical protein
MDENEDDYQSCNSEEFNFLESNVCMFHHRYSRLRVSQTVKSASHRNFSAVTEEMIESIGVFAASLAIEPGYSCTHTRQKLYILDDKLTSWKHVYDAYVEYLPNSKKFDQIRTMGFSTFHRYIRHVYSQYALRKLKEDACDTCIRMKVAMDDPYLPADEKLRIQHALEAHQVDARESRAAMRAAIREFGNQYIDSSDDDGIQAFNLAVSRIPEYNDEPLPEETEIKGKVLLLSEDFGGNLKLPWYGEVRPGSDYFLSDLNIYAFIVCNLSAARNHVFLYDERAMGKDCEALCSLRWMYHLSSYISGGKKPSSRPDVLYCIHDNCVGQNKSQVVMMFYALLNLVIYSKKTVIHFLKSGHSHMLPDRVHSWSKRSLRQKDIYHPFVLADCMNVTY